MPQITKQIQSFVLRASLTQEVGQIVFTFTDRTQFDSGPLPPARFSAIVETLQATPTAFFLQDVETRAIFISSSQDAPGN